MPPLSSRTINAERLMVLAWSRAILLQMAHPLIAAGVNEHSTFRAGPIASARRLHGTVRAMLALSFGERADAERAVERIRAIHRRVNGTLRMGVGRFPAGTRYSAEDPALLRWVHLTLIDSIVDLHARVVGPLTDAERDAYCDDSAWVPVALGARESEMPRTWADMRRAFDDVVSSGVLAVGDDARAIADAVLTPPLPRGMRWLIAPVSRVQRRLTVGTLPASIREQYGWAAPAANDLDRTYTRLRRLRRVLPRAIAWWPDARRGDRGQVPSATTAPIKDYLSH